MERNEDSPTISETESLRHGALPPSEIIPTPQFGPSIPRPLPFKNLEDLSSIIDLNHPYLHARPADGRLPLIELYKAYARLASMPGWIGEIIGWVPVLDSPDGNVDEAVKLPVISIRTEIRGRAIWVIAGVHGEEPAGPNALAKNIDLFEELRKAGIPVVLLPMMNPAGYFRDWRYFNYQNWHPNCPGVSVTDCDHLVPDPQNPSKPIAATPHTTTNGSITAAVIRFIADYFPRLVIDLHEDKIHDHTDEDLEPYIFSHGRFGARDGIARMVVKLLRKLGMPLEENGTTRDNQLIVNGVVEAVRDGSIDDMLASSEIFLEEKMVKKKAASSVIVVETTVDGLPLEVREKAHQAILKNLGNFWHYIQSKRKKVGKTPDNHIRS